MEVNSRAEAWKQSEMLRIAQEDGEFLGFIEISGNDVRTLAQVRQRMGDELDNTPKKFNFLLPDGVPVSLRQEKNILASDFLPHLTIRRGGSAPGASNKISVDFNGDRLSTWITADYTFGQLRKDSARYFNVSAGDVLLQDGEGCAWPEQARIESMFSDDSNDQPGVHLVLKASHRLTRTNSPTDELGGRPRGTKSAAPGFLKVPGSVQSAPARLASAASSDLDVESELWRIFTYYCVHGDAKEVEHLRRHQWLQLMRDVHLLGTGPAARTPAAEFRVIYSAETRGKTGSSGKMNYDEFLNALMNVSNRACTAGSGNLVPSRDALEAAFCELLVEYIMPNAYRWNTEVWDAQTQQLRLPEVVETLGVFKNALYDIFRFYSPADESPKQFSEFGLCLGYKEWMTFVQDFDFKNSLALSLQQIGEVFLAACHGGNSVLEEIGGHPEESVRMSGQRVRPARYAMTVRGTNGDGAKTIFKDTTVQRARNRIYFGNFCDAIMRTALFAFDGMTDENGEVTPENMIKALFQGLSRTLSRSRITRILSKRRYSCIHPRGLMKGTMALNAKYLTMWKQDGCCDYLHRERTSNDYIDSALGRSLTGTRRRGRRTTIEDISSPINRAPSLRGKIGTGSNNAKFSPSLKHTSPTNGTAAWSLSEAPLTLDGKHGKQNRIPRNFHNTGRSLLAKLLDSQNSQNQIEYSNVGGAGGSGPSVNQASPTLSMESMEVKSPDGNLIGGQSESDGLAKTVSVSLLSPNVMGGSGNERTTAFQPNMLLARNMSSKSIVNSGNSSQNGSPTSRYSGPQQVVEDGTNSKGYDYGKLFERRSESLNKGMGKSKSVRALSPKQRSIIDKDVHLRASKSSPVMNPSSPKQAILVGNNSTGAGSSKSSFGSKSSGGSGKSLEPAESFSNRPASQLHEVFPDMSIEECVQFLQINNNDLQKAMAIIMDNSVGHAKNLVADAHAHAVVRSMVQDSSGASAQNRTGEAAVFAAEAAEKKAKKKDAAMRRILQKGFLCYKHAARTTKRQRRYFYVTGDFQHFAWRPLQRGSTDSKRYPISDIQSIEKGNRDGLAVADDALVLSLVLTKRNVDLEFEDQATRDEVLEAFLWLLDQ